jgi:hypothetical protein
LFLLPGVASASLYWSPSSTSVKDEASLFMLLNKKPGYDLITRIECKSTLTGKTPVKTNTTFAVTLSVSNCTLNGSSIKVTAAGPTGPINLVATKYTWHPYWGYQTGGGDVAIPFGTTYEFKLKIGTAIDCTLKVNEGGGAYTSGAFTLGPYFSPELSINKAEVYVSVSGHAEEGESCAQSGLWYVDTYHPGTSPSLGIVYY